MVTTMTPENMKRRDQLKAAYNRIPKTEAHDERRHKAFDDLMAFEDEMLREGQNG